MEYFMSETMGKFKRLNPTYNTRNFKVRNPVITHFPHVVGIMCLEGHSNQMRGFRDDYFFREFRDHIILLCMKFCPMVKLYSSLHLFAKGASEF
jgi:hypothetical protein